MEVRTTAPSGATGSTSSTSDTLLNAGDRLAGLIGLYLGTDEGPPVVLNDVQEALAEYRQTRGARGPEGKDFRYAPWSAHAEEVDRAMRLARSLNTQLGFQVEVRIHGGDYYRMINSHGERGVRVSIMRAQLDGDMMADILEFARRNHAIARFGEHGCTLELKPLEDCPVAPLVIRQGPEVEIPKDDGAPRCPECDRQVAAEQPLADPQGIPINRVRLSCPTGHTWVIEPKDEGHEVVPDHPDYQPA